MVRPNLNPVPRKWSAGLKSASASCDVVRDIDCVPRYRFCWQLLTLAAVAGGGLRNIQSLQVGEQVGVVVGGEVLE